MDKYYPLARVSKMLCRRIAGRVCLVHQEVLTADTLGLKQSTHYDYPAKDLQRIIQKTHEVVALRRFKFYSDTICGWE